MAAYVALLRAVNVGGSGKVPMGPLRELFEAMGFTDVTTYIQSGNVVFASSSAVRNGHAIERELERTFGLRTAVVVRTAAELAAVVAHNPFVGPGVKATALNVTFLPDAPASDVLAGVDVAAFTPDDVAVRGRDVYLLLPDGIGRSKLAAAVARRLGPAATTRNWNTVTKLADLASAVTPRRSGRG